MIYLSGLISQVASHGMVLVSRDHCYSSLFLKLVILRKDLPCVNILCMLCLLK